MFNSAKIRLKVQSLFYLPHKDSVLYYTKIALNRLVERHQQFLYDAVTEHDQKLSYQQRDEEGEKDRNREF